MRLARIEGLAPSVKPVALSMSLATRIAGDAIVGTTPLSPEQADLDPRQQRHLSPATLEPVTDGERDEARHKWTQADRLCRPANPALIAYWCARLQTLAFAPQGEAAVDAAIGTICHACADLPGAVWNNETLTTALRTFKRWPSPAEVYALQLEHARPYLRTRDGLRRILDAPTATPVATPREPPSPQAIAEVEAATRALKAEFRRYEPSQALASGRPAKTLSTGALLVTWEQLAARGVGGAAARVEMLRKQLAKEAAE